MSKIIKLLKRVNLKTIVFNFKHFPLNHAIKLPVLISKNVYLKKNNGKITITPPIKTGLIQVGYGNVGIFDNKKSRSVWEVRGTVVFNGKCNIGHGSKISVAKSAELTLGNNFVITAESSIIVTQKVKFGDNCLMSWETLIMDTDYHKIFDQDNKLINPSVPISFGSNIWVGCRCLILKGSQIPDGSIIGANSLISSELKEKNTLYAGAPAKPIKSNVSWEY